EVANGRGSRSRSAAGGPPRPRSRAPLGARRGCGFPRVEEPVGAGDPVEQADEVAELRSPARPLGPGGEDPLMLLVAEQQTQGPDRPPRLERLERLDVPVLDRRRDLDRDPVPVDGDRRRRRLLDLGPRCTRHRPLPRERRPVRRQRRRRRRVERRAGRVLLLVHAAASRVWSPRMFAGSARVTTGPRRPGRAAAQLETASDRCSSNSTPDASGKIVATSGNRVRSPSASVIASETVTSAAWREMSRLIFDPSLVSNAILTRGGRGTTISPGGDAGHTSPRTTSLSSSAWNDTVGLKVRRLVRTRLPHHASWSVTSSSRSCETPCSPSSSPARSPSGPNGVLTFAGGDADSGPT